MAPDRGSTWYEKPAAETEEGKQRQEAYYAALGRFVHRFALAELCAHSVLYAKLPTATARVLLSGVRIDETKNRLSRLHEVGIIDDADWADAEPIFQQLNIINGCRNQILHHGAISSRRGAGLLQTLQSH
jgi:hypothetical protein